MQANKLTNITTSTTTHVVPAGQAFILHLVQIPATNAGTVTFQSANGVAYFVLPASSTNVPIEFDCVFGDGLDVVTAGSDHVIVCTNI